MPSSTAKATIVAGQPYSTNRRTDAPSSGARTKPIRPDQSATCTQTRAQPTGSLPAGQQIEQGRRDAEQREPGGQDGQRVDRLEAAEPDRVDAALLQRSRQRHVT